MTKKTSMKRRIAIVTAVLAGVAAIAYGGWAAWMNHVTFASAADCGAAQTVVKQGAVLTDAAAAKTWAAAARTQKDKIGHERLRTGVGKYIVVVDRIFSGPQLSKKAKSDAFFDMFDACRDIEVDYPTPR